MTAPAGSVLITGASTGIGAVYADRFARRGHDLVLVARDRDRLDALSRKLAAETGVAIDVLAADLADPAQRDGIERRLREDDRIGTLVNNAGRAAHGSLVTVDIADWQALIDLNITALTRLGAAIIPRFLQRGTGAIVNLGSVVGLAPEMTLGVYGASKAYVLALSQSMQVELGPKGIYVQAVLPAATRTEIWGRSGRDVDAMSGVMAVDELVDAALAGFDRREAVTIPSLPDEAQWVGLETARKAMLPNLGQSHPAPRYLT